MSTIKLILCGLTLAAGGAALVQQVQPGPSNTIRVTNPAGPTTTLDAAIPFVLSTSLHHATSPAQGVIEVLNRGDINGVYALSDSGDGVVGRTSGPIGSAGVLGIGQFDAGVRGIAEERGAGVWGSSQSGIGILGTGGMLPGVPGSGVVGRSTNQQGYGVSGEASDIGVFAHNLTSPANVAYLGARCCAGDFYGTVYVHGADTVTGPAYFGGRTVFDGEVHINGTLTKPAGAFRIDDPTDPENKYLYHSFVESPDMMDIYNGNAALDSTGTAWITLPTWFEALNMDFRYQLTALGKPGPGLYIAEGVRANRFEIAGGVPGATVSWQVTGIRHDRYANSHRIPVEVDKPVQDRRNPSPLSEPDHK